MQAAFQLRTEIGHTFLEGRAESLVSFPRSMREIRRPNTVPPDRRAQVAQQPATVPGLAWYELRTRQSSTSPRAASRAPAGSATHLRGEGAVIAMRPSIRILFGLVTVAIAFVAAFCAARLQAQVATVPVAALERLLPAPDGWTKAEAKADTVVISTDCSHPVASVSYVQGEMRVKITLADSGMHPDSLMALAPMLVMLPEGYSEKIPPAITIRRLQRDGAQVAERWDERKHDGEITMLVNKRFVASVEGSHVDSLDSLRTILDQIDLKKLAELR